jgi:hypothetical protein
MGLNQYLKYHLNFRLLIDLQEELNELKNRPSSSVGKVEYKFDQLKVENLNGRKWV